MNKISSCIFPNFNAISNKSNNLGGQDSTLKVSINPMGVLNPPNIEESKNIINNILDPALTPEDLKRLDTKLLKYVDQNLVRNITQEDLKNIDPKILKNIDPEVLKSIKERSETPNFAGRDLAKTHRLLNFVF